MLCDGNSGGEEADKPRVLRRVRWRVDGKDQVRSFEDRSQAQRLRSQLQHKAATGTEFDSATVLPPSVGPMAAQAGLGRIFDAVA